MDIIVAGAGRVGHLLAQTLSAKHNVTVIDKDADVLQVLQESVDLLTIAGDIENPDIYRSLTNKHFDIFIAVTDSDEANLLSTLIANDVIDAKKKIIRLKNAYFAKSTIAEKLGIDDAVFPFADTASSIRALLDYPKANNVKTFNYTNFKLISVFVQNSSRAGMRIGDLIAQNCVIVGLEREKTFFIPDHDTVLQEHDLLYFFGDGELIKKECDQIDTKMPQKIKNIAIFGAGLLGLEIAKALVDKNIQLKVIEKDSVRCMHAAEILQEGASVIQSRYIEHTLFEEEQIARSDMVIVTDTKDEENIIRCLEAKEWGVEKTVAINNNTEYYELMHKLGIVASRGPKINAYYAILEKIGSSSVIFEKHYCGGHGTIFSRRIFPGSALIGKSIKPLCEPDIVTFLLRDEVLIPFILKEELAEGDQLFVFMESSEEERVREWIYAL